MRREDASLVVIYLFTGLTRVLCNKPCKLNKYLNKKTSYFRKYVSRSFFLQLFEYKYERAFSFKTHFVLNKKKKKQLEENLILTLKWKITV